MLWTFNVNNRWASKYSQFFFFVLLDDPVQPFQSDTVVTNKCISTFIGNKYVRYSNTTIKQQTLYSCTFHVFLQDWYAPPKLETADGQRCEVGWF